MANNNVDKENMIEVLRNFPGMIHSALPLGDDVTVPKEFVENIVIAGMGGSGFTGDILKVFKILSMGKAYIGYDSYIRAGNFTKPSNLSLHAHSHLKDCNVVFIGKGKKGNGKTYQIIEIAFILQNLKLCR